MQTQSIKTVPIKFLLLNWCTLGSPELYAHAMFSTYYYIYSEFMPIFPWKRQMKDFIKHDLYMITISFFIHEIIFVEIVTQP